VLHSIRAFPGVRLAAVDRARGWLVLGGLSPVLEIRSLHDYKPIHRLTAPPWMRWFQIDSAAGKAYLTSCSHGLWELDLEALADKGPAPFVARHDPFYRLAALLADAVQTSLGWDSDVLEFQPTEPAIFNAAPCPDGSWTDPPPAENESSLPAATD